MRARPALPPATTATARPRSRASQRKVKKATAPPPPTPAAAGAPKNHQAPAVSAATTQAPTRVTRAAKSAMAIRTIRLVQRLDGAEEVHGRRRNPKCEPDQHQPRLGAQPTIRKITRRQSDCHARRQHGAECDEFGGMSWRRFTSASRHVNRNTITAFRL